MVAGSPEYKKATEEASAFVGHALITGLQAAYEPIDIRGMTHNQVQQALEGREERCRMSGKVWVKKIPHPDTATMLS